MIENMVLRKEERDKRLDHRSARNTFTNLIADGTNCSRFEAEVISDKAEVVFALGSYAEDQAMQPGQMVWRAIRATEPAGKPLRGCEFVRIRLSVHALEDDREVRREHGLSAKRQQQIARMCLEARDQGALLTQEDLATLLDCDVKTIRNDIKVYQKRTGLMVQTRGTVCDIGPGVTHREKTVEMFIQGREVVEIARDLTHSLKAVERYITTFCRTVYAQSQMKNTLKTAMVVGISVANVNRNLELRDNWIKRKEYRQRLDEIEQIGLAYWEAQDEKKGLSPQSGRP